MKSALVAFTTAVALVAPADAANLRRGWTTPEQQLSLIVAIGTFVSARCSGLSSSNQAIVDWAIAKGYSTQDMNAARSASFLWVSRLERAPADESCSEILSAFGPNGALVPDIVRSK